MADQDNEMTTDKILAKRLVSIGIKIDSDDRDIDRQLSPTLLAINNKLKVLTKENEKAAKAGILGSGFWTEKVKAFTGFDYALLKSTKNMISYGLASKDMDVDNKAFYKSLGMGQKFLVKISGLFVDKAKAQKDSTEKDKEATNATNDLTAVLNQAESATTKIGPAAEEAAVGVEVFATVATAGLAAVVAILAAIGIGFYKMFMQAVVARDEFKKFDQLFGGLGRSGVTEGIGELANLNKQLWGLGMSLEAVNKVALDSTKLGLNYHRAIQSDFVGPILELSGATGIAAEEIGGLYTELLKTTKMDNKDLSKIGNAFIQFNRFAHDTNTLGQLSFAQFKTGIETSANALAIASSRGKQFTDSMIKDLTTLSGLAQTLSLDVGTINSKFEEAGSMILNQESGFRNLLAISGGANINQMLSNQFDKTDAMLKGVTFLQEFNKSFGGNIQLTAQVAERSLGISKEMAIKMINMRQGAIDDMIKAQKDISGLQNDATKDAFEKVNSDLSSMWNRVKTMFVTFFQNAFGSSGGLQGLLARVETFLADMRDKLQNSEWMGKVASALNRLANWIGDNLIGLINWINNLINKFIDPDESVVTTLLSAITDALMAPFFLLGKMLGAGIASMLHSWFRSEEADKVIAEQGVGGGSGTSTFKAPNAAERLLQNDISGISARQADLSKYNPETITYGKRVDNTVGFQTVGEAEFQLQEAKEAKEAKLLALQEENAKNNKATAENTRILRELAEKEQDPANRAVPTSYSPIGVGQNIDLGVA